MFGVYANFDISRLGLLIFDSLRCQQLLLSEEYFKTKCGVPIFFVRVFVSTPFEIHQTIVGKITARDPPL